METAQEALLALTRRYAFGEVAALIGECLHSPPGVRSAEGAGRATLTTREIAEVQQLCAFGQRLLDLDAEDFGQADAAMEANTEHEIADQVTGDEVPPALVARALACRMPQSPREHDRGALGSLRPAYRLLLEVIDARFRRRETTEVVMAAHIASEYGPLLVWERVWGHAGDPARLPAEVEGEGSAWGDFDDRGCPHTKTEKSAAKRAIVVSSENGEGWRSYLDRQHSNTAHALAVCAAECRRQCFVYTRLSASDAEIVTAGSQLAIAFSDSALVKLRHSAPVGHGFGVPSRAELFEAWGRSRATLARIDPSIAEDDGFVLPGFAALITALAGEPVKPDTLIADTADYTAAILRVALPDGKGVSSSHTDAAARPR